MLEAFPLLRVESAGIQALTFHAGNEKSSLENLTGPRATKDTNTGTTHKKAQHDHTAMKLKVGKPHP